MSCLLFIFYTRADMGQKASIASWWRGFISSLMDILRKFCIKLERNHSWSCVCMSVFHCKRHSRWQRLLKILYSCDDCSFKAVSTSTPVTHRQHAFISCQKERAERDKVTKQRITWTDETEHYHLNLHKFDPVGFLNLEFVYRAAQRQSGKHGSNPNSCKIHANWWQANIVAKWSLPIAIVVIIILHLVTPTNIWW